MTYSEALQSHHWQSFRGDFIKSRNNLVCEDCGEDTPLGTLHVHHKVYRKGLLPWEYGFEDLRLICKDCHQTIHTAEELCRQVIRALPPHVCHEFNDFLSELSRLEPRQAKVALARAKNFAREF